MPSERRRPSNGEDYEADLQSRAGAFLAEGANNSYQSYHLLRHTTRSSTGDRESISSYHAGSGGGTTSSAWFPGQEYSRIQTYDPLLDVLHAQRYASERHDLKFRQVFRFATWYDWLLMLVGLILAVGGSLVTPWLYFWSGTTIHDILIFARCLPKNATGCNEKIPGYCHTTLPEVGVQLFYKILWGWISYNVIQFGYCICFTAAADRQTKAMRAAYFKSIVCKDMAWFDLYADKDFAKEMTEQITHIRLGIGDVIPNFVNLVCTVIAMTIIVFLLNYQIAISFLCFIPISMLTVYMGNWAEKKRAMVSDMIFNRADIIANESLVNIKVIKMYNAGKKQVGRFKEALRDVADVRKEVKWMAVAALSSGLIWVLLNLATAVVFWLGQNSYETYQEFCERQEKWGLLSLHSFFTILLEEGIDLRDSPAEILVVYFGLTYITMHAVEVPNFLSLMKIAKKNATGVFFIIDWKSRIDNTSKEGKLPKRSAVGRLDFSNVSFRYPQRPDETVLNIRQLTIYGGQFIAFAGPANSGKNTILKLIPRLYDVCSGFITLDAVNVQNYNIHWLRRQICVISEAPVIFTGTISENILFGKLNASEDEITKACQMADVHHIIEKLPNGYNTKITGKEFGDQLSRNEKRQVCLARAYLHRSRVILLDNPLTPEDDLLEPQLLRFVHHFRDTATVVLASTNVTALSKRADCIYYMENGYILESGSHIQLIQARGKYYDRLEGTINCSTESRNKFESQLKAYKYSQLLQKKRKSSLGGGLGEPVFETSEGTTAPAGEETPHKKKHFWKNLVTTDLAFASGRRPSLKEGGVLREDKVEEVDTGMEGEERRRSLKKIRDDIQISHLEETYDLYSGKRRMSGGGSYMHNGFSMMGFQRINFARPMTNYSTQIKKQRHAFFSTFANVGSASLNFLRTNRLSLLSYTKEEDMNSQSPTNTGNDGGAPSLSPSSRPSRTRVRFSLNGPGAKDRPKGVPTKKDTTSAKSSKQKDKNVKSYRRATIESSNKVKILQKKRKRSVQSADQGKLRRKSDTSPASILHLPTGRASFQDALNKMIHPTSFHINEHVEIDNVSIMSEDLDSFLMEYDQGVYSTMHSDVKGYWRDVFFVIKHDWLVILPAMIASVIIGVAIPYQGWIVGTYFETLGNEEADVAGEVKFLSKSILIVGVVTAVAAFTQEFFFANAGRRMTRRLREKLFHHLLTQDLSWFDEKSHDIGVLSYQLNMDTTAVHYTLMLLYGIIIQVCSNVASSMTLVALETSDDLQILTMIFILGMPVLIGIVYFSSRKELSEAEHLEKRFRVAGDFAQEFVTNIKTWFSLGAEDFFISQHKKILDREYTFIRLSSIFTTCLHTIVQTSSWLIYGIFLYFALYYHDYKVHSLKDHGSWSHPTLLTKPSLIGFIMIATELLIFGAYKVGDQIAILTDVELGKTAAHKIMRILVNEPETDPPHKTTMSSNELAEEDLFRPPPEIGLTNITYFYPGTDRSLQEGHLRNVSMTIASSSYVAIVGPPGSGKSTLCNIILRMCNPTTGILDFNGDDSYDFSPKVSRRLMGLVEYDPCLFDCSILENIRYGNLLGEPSQVDIEEATKLSNCHYDILDFNDDYDTLISEMDKTAQNFSLKQRISFARALLKKPKILIIDDATTSTDIETDHKILEVIANVREGRTLVVFSHKIEPVRDADMIYVLWGGEMVESGTDSFLLRKKGYYYEMYMTQKVLADTMRNSPQQLRTIRYNIKNIPNMPIAESNSAANISKQALEEIAAKPKEAKRHSSIAFVKFLNEKVGKLKEEKEQRRTELDRELPLLEEEEKQRAKRKSNVVRQ